MLAKIRRSLARYLTEPVVRVIAKTKLSPNALTILGFLLSLVIAWVLGTGHLFLGGFLVLFSGWFDLLDGALARATGQATRFGALFDSAIDRLSEAALLSGLLFFYAAQGSFQESLLIFAVFVGSVMVSYIRARAEGLGLEARVGLFTRPERLVLLALGLILSPIDLALLIVLWILAVGTNLTAIQRLFYIWRKTRREKGETMSEQKDKPMSDIHFKFMSFGYVFRDLWHGNLRAKLEKIGIREGQTVLDFGCGPGSYTIPAAQIVGEKGRVYALDIHPLAIKAVEEKAKKKKLTNITAILSHGDTGLPDESVEVVLLYDTIHHIKDRRALLAELHRVLKRDGFLSVTDHHLKANEMLETVEGTGLFSLREQDEGLCNFKKGS